MVVRTMMVMMVAGGECGTCQRNEQKSSEEKLLHGLNVARMLVGSTPFHAAGTKSGTGCTAVAMRTSPAA